MLVPRREDRLEESSSEQGLRVGPPFSRHQAPEPSSCEFFFLTHTVQSQSLFLPTPQFSCEVAPTLEVLMTGEGL